MVSLGHVCPTGHPGFVGKTPFGGLVGNGVCGNFLSFGASALVGVVFQRLSAFTLGGLACQQARERNKFASSRGVAALFTSAVGFVQTMGSGGCCMGLDHKGYV